MCIKCLCNYRLDPRNTNWCRVGGDTEQLEKNGRLVTVSFEF